MKLVYLAAEAQPLMTLARGRDSSGGYADNPFLAEFYDSVVPYQERQDLLFFVELALRSGGRCWGSDVAPDGSSYRR
ncbi:MAG: hypothetical protein H0T77_05370 [Pyrinomonadaceae bacterium]|nr:hypothetical protein [Pyrinomonadaceae bacterium]